MFFIELFAPRGALSAEQRHQAGVRLAGFVEEGEAHAFTQEHFRGYIQVVVHEVDTWVVGEDAVGAGGPLRYVLRATVPSPWLKDLSGELTGRFTRIITELDAEAHPDTQKPEVWVVFTGVREGGWGMGGQPVTSEEMAAMFHQEFRAAVPDTGPVPGPRPGTVIDPMCGMVVELDDAAITLEHEGATYGYCAKSCRRTHAEQLGVEVSRV